MLASKERSYDFVAICYIIVVCLAQRRSQGFLEPFQLAETLHNRFFPFFIDGCLEMHTHHTSLFSISSLFNSKNKPKPELDYFVPVSCLCYQIVYSNVCIYTQTYICVYLYIHINPIWMISICFSSLLLS